MSPPPERLPLYVSCLVVPVDPLIDERKASDESQVKEVRRG